MSPFKSQGRRTPISCNTIPIWRPENNWRRQVSKLSMVNYAENYYSDLCQLHLPIRIKYRWIRFRNKCTDLGDVCNIEKSQNMKLDTVWNFSLREEKPYQSAKLWALKQQFMHCQVTLSSHKMKIRKVFVLSIIYFHENIIFNDRKTKAKAGKFGIRF